MKTKTIIIVCISDSFGQEIQTGTLDEVNLEEALEVEHEDDNEDCETGDCSCADYSNMASIYEVDLDIWNNREETGFNNSHSSHWLNKNGVELDLGDFV